MWYGICPEVDLFDCLAVTSTCIADFELAPVGNSKFSKGRATPAGYARMLACARIARAARAPVPCGIAIPLF